MAKHTLSLHLSDARKKRLDALISHSEYEGHGAQSEFLRSLIDQAEDEHPEIEFDDPQKAVKTDELEYHPIDYDGLLDQQQVREILNSEKAPAINPEHCPPIWEPRDKSNKAVLMAAYYRYYRFLARGYEDDIQDLAIDDVIGMTSSKKKNEYRDQLNQILDTYGEDPSNLILIEETSAREWIANMNNLLGKDMVANKVLSQHMQLGEKMRQKADDVNEDRLAEDIGQVIEKLRRRKQES
jgi:hypothetical protein